MSTSLRDKRLQIFAYTDASANGVPAVSYAFNATWWGGIVPTSGKTVVVGDRAEHQVNAVIALADEAVIGQSDVIVDAATNVAYRVLAVLPRPLARELEVLAITVDVAVLTFTGTPQP